MPGKSNPKGGKGHRKNKKPVVENNIKNMEYREEGEEYAKVTSLLGNGRIRVQLPNKTEKLAIIPGRMKKKRYGNFIAVDDITLVGVRSWDTRGDKVDVLYRYNPEQVLILQAKQELPAHWTKDSLHQEGAEINLTENEPQFGDMDFTGHNSYNVDDGGDGVVESTKVCDETGIDFDEI